MTTTATPAESVVTPGNHDGVHLGHRALIDAARRRAQAEGLDTVAVCFDPHPTSVLAPERAPTLLTTMSRRVEILKGSGCDHVKVLPFDTEFAATPPRVFVEDILQKMCNAKGIIIGPDFHFGKGRSGNVDTLREFGARAGFTVEVVEPVMLDGESVSSTRIRRVLREQGDVRAAARMLTRVHDVVGQVVEGDHRGQQIGFPTANLRVEPVQLPTDGVYSVVAKELDDDEAPLYMGVANLGIRPTFDAGRSVEVHLFDFDKDLYDRRLRVGFVGRIRAEKTFDGLAALKAQIDEDCDLARRELEEVDQELLRWI